jgi:signal transduction histidine kinase
VTPVFRSIRARLLVTYLLITLLGMTVVSGYLIWAFRDFYINRAQEELQVGGMALDHSLQGPLQAGNHEQVNTIAQSYPQPSWVTLRIFDASGRLLAVKAQPEYLVGPDRRALWIYDAAGKLERHNETTEPVNREWYQSWLGEAMATRRPVAVSRPGMERNEEKRILVVPVLAENRALVGAVRLSLYPIDFEKVFTQVRDAAIGALLAAFVLCTIVSLLVARGVARPVRAMSGFAEAIGAGRFGEHLAIRSRDELGALAAHLNRMSDRLADTERERREFLAAVSHELRTPVSNVQVTLESLIGGAAEEPALRGRFLQAALGETGRLSDLIRDLIDLARLEAGVVTMRQRQVPLATLTDRAAAAVEPRLRDRGLSVLLDVPSGLHVWADPNRLLQVFMILLDNAIKFAPAGSAIHFSASENRDEVRIACRDEGPGIAPEDLPHVFERFYTGDKSRARGPTGTGLGLAIARRIVEAHSGQIHARSEPDQGAEFLVSLPR